MKLSGLFWLCKLGVLVFFVLLTLGIRWKAPWLTALGILILVIAALAFQFRYRCPSCHKRLNSRRLTPEKTCPCCGRDLENA